jgi:uncharacterized membrane protein YeaQ/YmgE (transglycosylase-associated protein family)
MNKIQRSIKLLKAAFAVLFREKKLLLFPFIATGLALVIFLFFAIPVVLYPTGHPFFSMEHWSVLAEKLAHPFAVKNHGVGQPMLIGKYNPGMALGENWYFAPILGGFYLLSMFLATFCNVAFYHEIMQALNGQAVSIRRGFQFAMARWRAVLLWSLFAGLVGYLINAIEQRLGFIGRIIAGFIGLAWSASCIFIIPTLVRDTEVVNPLRLLRNSAGTLKRTWGELIIGFVGLEMIFGAVLMVVLVGFVGIGFAVYAFNPHFTGYLILILLAGFAVMVLVAMLLSWVSSIVNPVYRCALYIYATEGVVPGTFDQELLDSAWKVK